MPIKVFVSCLKEDNSKKLIEMIVKELKQCKYEIINESSLFEEHNIENNKKVIDLCDWTIIFLTKKTVAEKSPCLKELKYIQKNERNFLPILIDENADIPMSVGRTQWIPFTRTFKDGEFDEEYFNLKIQEVDNVLAGRVNKDLIPDIFISYGHDKFADILVKKIAHDLKEAGLTPWIDYDYLYGSDDWEFKIEDGINNATWVLFFVTEHSMNRPDGYCLKEITYTRSRKNRKKIVPISIQNIDTPISIIEIPQIDFSKSIIDTKTINLEEYNKNLNKIIDILKGKVPFEVFDSLKSILNPLDNTSYLVSNPSFYGREWLIQKYEDWLLNDNSKVFCLLGSAGSGKTQFISYLSDKSPNIHGIHFCKYDDSRRSNPKYVIMSLAYHLAKQFPKYKELLLKELETQKDLKKESVGYIFNLLFVDILNHIEYDPKEKDGNGKEKGPIVLVIDAIDETIDKADNMGIGTMRSQLIKLITENFKYETPPWLKLFITSRPEIGVEARLRSLNPFTIDTNSDQNINDVKGYLSKELQPFIENKTISEKQKIIDTVNNKSQGNFIYASRVIKDLQEKVSTIDDYEKFPNGLGQSYLQYFDRLFPDLNIYKRDFKPLLNILAAQLEPLNKTIVEEILNISDSKFLDMKDQLSSLFTFSNGILQPFHKSLIDYLANDEQTATYGISKLDGHKVISNYLYNKYKNNNLDDYCVKYLAEHCIKANEIDKAEEILKDKEILEQKIKLLGADLALEKYFDEVRDVFVKNKRKAKEILISKTFLDIFGKYRKIIQSNEIYDVLHDIGAGGLIYNSDPSFKNFNPREDIPFETEIALGYLRIHGGEYWINYWWFLMLLRSKGKSFIFKKQNDKNIENIVWAELYNIVSELSYNLCIFDEAYENADKVHYLVEQPKSIEEYYELAKSFYNLGILEKHLCSKYPLPCLESPPIPPYIEHCNGHFRNALSVVYEAQKTIKRKDDLKRFKVLELHILTEIVYKQIFNILVSGWGPASFTHEGHYKVTSLINEFNKLKLFNQDYIKCLCIEMMLNIFEQKFELVELNYKEIIRMSLSIDNQILVEFLYALSCYFQLKNDDAKKHIEMLLDNKGQNFIHLNSHWISLIKIGVLDLIINNNFSDENIFKWFDEIWLEFRKNQFKELLQNHNFNVTNNIKKTANQIYKIINLLNDYFKWIKTHPNYH